MATTSATEILNNQFGEDLDCLDTVEDVYEKFLLKKKSLLSAISESEKQTSKHVTNIIQSCDSMLTEIHNISEEINNIVEQYQNHNEEASTVKTALTSLHNEIQQLENKKMYLLWKQHLGKLKTEVNSHIQKSNIQLAVKSHHDLYKISLRLQKSTCTKLKTYSYELCQHIYEELKDVLSKQMDSLLLAMKYPFSTGLTSPLFVKKDETEENFCKTVAAITNLKSLSDSDDYTLLADIVTQPMRKRFKFHFYGAKNTNNEEKPEWYLTQVMNWIRDHTPFLEDYVQKLVDKQQHEETSNVTDDFCRILVKLCEEKLTSSLDILRANDELLAHYIDEVLLFEKELQLSVGTLQPSIGCLHILLHESFLEHWINLEKKFALESMNETLQHEDAWLSTFSDLNVTDKRVIYFVPQCVEKVMTFLSLMTDRHKTLNQRDAQRKFLEVIIESVNTFIDKVKKQASIEALRPESQHFCSILNGMYYIYHVLNEWSDDLYFIQLMDEEEGVMSYVFSDVMENLQTFIDRLVESISEDFENGFKSKVKLYRGERWHALPSLKDYLLPVLSSTACGVILYIKQYLTFLEENLCSEVFEKVWKETATVVDNLIFQEIIFDCHFNEGGSAQFQFDMKKNLFVIFSQYTSRPSSYFKLIHDSCVLLNLLPGSAVLLKELISQAENSCGSETEKEKHVRSSLNDVGVKQLSFSQISRIMKARIDWPKV